MAKSNDHLLSGSMPTWPYLFVLGVAGILSLPTALMLTLSGLDTGQRMLATAVVFLALSGALAHYVRCCLTRRFARPSRVTSEPHDTADPHQRDQCPPGH
jgi:hypothetical protein